MSQLPRLAAGLGMVALGLAACGGSSSTSSSAATSSAVKAGGGGGLTIAAAPSGQLAFTKKTLTAKAGTVTIAFTNKAPEPHNLAVQKGTDGPVLGSTPTFRGATKALTVKLAPGTYTFYCSVPGHRMAGMKGTLTVT
jgi:plastocyanin